MKIFKLLAIVFFSSIISCNPDSTKISEEQKLSNIFLGSDEFKSLNLPISDLNISEPQLVTSTKGTKSVVLLFKSKPSKAVFGAFDSKGDLLGGYVFEATQNIPSPDDTFSSMSERLENGSFSGRFHIVTSKSFEISYHLENSFVIQNKSKIVNLRTSAECEGLADALECGIYQIGQMRFFARIACFIGFIACVLVEAADCWLYDLC